MKNHGMNKLAVINPGLTTEQVDLIKRTICKDATKDELALFLYQCERTRLDPLSRQIYFVKYGGKVTIIVAIDGYRSIAARTGIYAGSDDAIFDDEKKPTKATVTVYKMIQCQRCAFSATARWDEYYPGEKMGFKWRQMPTLMLAKCAEALALRKAFPYELSGLYTPEEMEQANLPQPVIEAEPIDTYTGTAQQNAQLKTWCDEFVVDSKDKPKILKEIIGKTLREARTVIEKFGNKPEF